LFSFELRFASPDHLPVALVGGDHETSVVELVCDVDVGAMFDLGSI
jgi:hypothetical protein